MARDSFDEFEVWNLNKLKEGKKKCFHWKISVEEQSCALGQPPRMETHEHTEKGHWWVLSHFLFFPLVPIKRLEEDQPCQNKMGRTGSFCTGLGCPNQGLLDLWGNCRFIEISEFRCGSGLAARQQQKWCRYAQQTSSSWEGCKYHFAEDIQTSLKFCFWGPTQKVFYIFAIFDRYIGMCFMANLRITELQEYSCPALCSKLICSSVPRIN